MGFSSSSISREIEGIQSEEGILTKIVDGFLVVEYFKDKRVEFMDFELK